jgi:hypothetical protein
MLLSMHDTTTLLLSNLYCYLPPVFEANHIFLTLRDIRASFFMGAKRGFVRQHRGPNLPDRTQDRESFQRNIKCPSGSEEEFARRHADLYGNEENLVDGRHVGTPHFPRRSERARLNGQHSLSNHFRDTTRNAYKFELDAAIPEYEELPDDQVAY